MSGNIEDDRRRDLLCYNQSLFVAYDPFRADDYETPAIGDSLWIGPLPHDRLKRTLSEELNAAARLAKKGVFLSVKLVGEYICLHRLKQGPVRKLSDWKGLVMGEALMLNPYPSADDVDLAYGRSRYLQHTMGGRFAPEVRENGSLWVARTG